MKLRLFETAVAALVCLFHLNAFVVDGAGQQEVTLRFRNDSNEWIAIHWVNPNTSETAIITNNIKPNITFTLNSFLNHKFQVWQLPDPDSGECRTSGGGGDNDQTCKIDHFQVTDYPEQAFIIKKGVDIETVQPKRLKEKENADTLLNEIDLEIVEDPKETLAACKARATELLHEIEGRNISVDTKSMKDRINQELHDCITVGFAPRIKASMDEIEFERLLRVDASWALENFTCANAGTESSPDVRTDQWTSLVDDVTRTVHVKLDRPASRIHLIENFASPAECDAMEKEAEKGLHVASTADGKGGTKVSIARKAMQAGIKPKFEDENGNPVVGNSIADLSNRVYEYTNRVLDMNITYHGQEPLMSIQYFGRGKHDQIPDRYTPHCDGTCTGAQHTYGGRMATTVIYCTIPSQGGATNFGNSNVHIKPNPGSAVFFSYINPLTNETDNGFTQHSGCPVYEGEKKIITQWVRYGVDKKTPHGAYNTLGVLYSESGE